MDLELLSRTSQARPGRPSLLFIHGGFHAAWCWEAHYLGFFAERGWATHAVSLRGHGASEGADEILRFTLADYGADVTATVERIGGPVVLLGHSMGGAIAERCWAADERVAGLALLAGSPLRPALSVIAKMLLRSPSSLLLGQIMGDPQRLRRAMAPFFLEPDAGVSLDELGLESPVAMRELFRREPVVRVPGDARPVLVVAAVDDASIPVRAHEAAAQRLQGTLVRVPGAHDLMLDPRWRTGAQAVETWLCEAFD